MKTWQTILLFLFIAGAAFAVVLRERLGLEPDDEITVTRGKASYYGEAYRGKRMANGERFDPTALTCATWEWPLGSWLEITHNKRTVVVRVTDRGPAFNLGRLVDLSQGAFEHLANWRLGVIDVTIREVAPQQGGAQ